MTEQSETLAKLSEALSKAQGAMRPAVRDHTNPFFKTKYADLASVWESIRKPLSDNNLAITQAITETTPTSITIETRLLHASGEYITSVMSMPTGKGDIQALGSAISYGRRYSLSALIGVVSDDEDDGEAAKGTPQKGAPTAKPAPKSNLVEAAEEVPFDDGPTSEAPDAAAKEVSRKRRNVRLGELFRLATEFYGADGVVFAMKAHIKKMGLESSKDMTDAQIEEQIVEFERRCDAKKQETKEAQP